MKNSPQITPAQIEDLRTGNGKPFDYIPPVYTDELTARLDAPISEIRNLAQVGKTHFVSAVLMDFKNGKYEKQVLNVQAIHRAEGRSSRYTAAKKELPAFTFGGIFAETRANKNLRISSGLVICDLDAIGDKLEDCFKKVCNDRHVLAAWKSPSGDGLKFLVAIPFVKDDSEYKGFLRPLEKYFKQTHGIFLEFGKDGSDIARNCFACYDPDLYLAESVELFTEKSPYNQPKTKAELKPGKPSQVHFQNSEFAKNAIDACLGIIKRSFPPDNSRPGNRHRSRLTAGILAGGYIAGGVLNENQVIPLLESAVSANTTLKLETAFKDVLDGIEYGKQAPITQEQKKAERQTWINEHYSKFENERRAGQNSNNDRKRAETGQESPIPQGGGESIPRIERISAYELATTDFPELDWVIPGVMPEGFVKLAGKSETGKSLMALNIAVAVALGGYAYSFENSEYQKCKQGRVLYIGLETTKRREGSRLKKFCKFWQIEDLTKLKELDFSFSIAKAEIGGLDQLRQEIEILKPRLAIVDTLALFSGNDKIGYKSDYQTSDAIRKLTREYPGTNILGVTHARQMRSELSPFDEMQGTEGERAGADCTMLIRMENDFTALHISGNDIERKEYVIELDKEYLVWKLKGDAKAHQNTLQRQEIIDLLAGNGDGMTYREITDSLPGNRNYNTVRTIVERMFKKGDLIKGNDKRYTIAQTRLSELTQQPFLKS